MLELTLDMEQYDCPFIAASDAHDVRFSSSHWEFDPAGERLDTRMVVEGATPAAVDGGLRVLRDHEGLCEYDLVSRRGALAHVRTTIEETAAMSTILFVLLAAVALVYFRVLEPAQEVRAE